MMENQLKIYGILHKLNLSTWEELRKVADDALNKEIYSPSLVDVALDAEENIYDIGLAFINALTELKINIPESTNKCLWLALQHYITAIAEDKLFPYEGLVKIMRIYYGCNLYSKDRHYTGNSHDIHYFVGYYWEYQEIQEAFSLTLEEKKKATIDFDSEVIKIAKSWLQKHQFFT